MGNASSAEFITAAASLRMSPVPEDGAQDADAFWSRLLSGTNAVPADSVFSVIQPEHVREILHKQPRNLARVITKARAGCRNRGCGLDGHSPVRRWLQRRARTLAHGNA
jgi:hypothetical protein